MAKKQHKKRNINIDAINKAAVMLEHHPLFEALSQLAWVEPSDKLPKGCWAQIEDSEDSGWCSMTKIHVNHNIRLKQEQWQYILSLAFLHLGLNHLDPDNRTKEWQVACELYTLVFAKQVGVGRKPDDFYLPHMDGLPMHDEHSLMSYFMQQGNVQKYVGFGIGGEEVSWKVSGYEKRERDVIKQRSQVFARGLSRAVREAVNEASDTVMTNCEVSEKLNQANNWVINSFPLLSALASNFTLIEDKEVCQRMQIDIAAIHPELQEVYFNPRWNFDKEELIFILLHEYLHVGLRHDVREQGRDAYLWNIACDYVINGWLVEMGVGRIPAMGMLYDPELKGRGAEDIYDEITRNLRWQRKLAKMKTPRGNQKPDMINDKPPKWWTQGKGVALDEFYRRSLQEGLEYAEERGRGLLPAGLIEDIKAINQKPIPWDVQLTKWLDQFFPPIERKRSYARMSRRQSATPDIPRPSWVMPNDPAQSRTFGVILDTSGSMTRRELGMALGAISSYAGSRDVEQVRLVYCDAHPYDAGYVDAESLLERIKVKGRGGTVLQPAVDLLQRADDFPDKGPMLIITDGGIDHLHVKMEHAYLLPKGMRLPYRTPSPVFYFSGND